MTTAPFQFIVVVSGRLSLQQRDFSLVSPVTLNVFDVQRMILDPVVKASNGADICLQWKDILFVVAFDHCAIAEMASVQVLAF